MRAYWWVAAGGALGSVVRAVISAAYPLQHSFHIVWINILGSFLLALIFTHFSAAEPFGLNMRWLLGTGIMGGFTTMSTFSLDVVTLLEQEQLGIAALYICTSILGGLLATVLGVSLVLLTRKRKQEGK